MNQDFNNLILKSLTGNIIWQYAISLALLAFVSWDPNTYVKLSCLSCDFLTIVCDECVLWLGRGHWLWAEEEVSAAAEHCSQPCRTHGAAALQASAWQLQLQGRNIHYWLDIGSILPWQPRAAHAAIWCGTSSPSRYVTRDSSCISKIFLLHSSSLQHIQSWFICRSVIISQPDNR